MILEGTDTNIGFYARLIESLPPCLEHFTLIMKVWPLRTMPHLEEFFSDGVLLPTNLKTMKVSYSKPWLVKASCIEGLPDLIAANWLISLLFESQD